MTEDRNEKAIRLNFKKFMRKNYLTRKEYNIPIAKYDVTKRKVYLEYPDGNIKYYNDIEAMDNVLSGS